MRKDGASSKELGKQEKRLYNHGLGHTQTIEDICLQKAQGDMIIDTDGTSYIDLNGTLNLPLGHRWELARKVLKEDFPLNAVSYATCERLELCQKLEELFPEYSSFQFYSAGTEANEGAIRYAIAITGKDGFASFRKSYHGRTRATVSLCNMKEYNGNRLSGYYRVDYPSSEEEEERVLRELKDMIQMEHKRTTAGVFIEPIQGKTIVIPPQDFLKRLKEEICEPNQLLFIADEYLTSMRCGVYSVCISKSVYPDIITIGKCLGNGIPLAVMMCRKEYVEKVKNVKGSTTFGGNPFSCKMGLENLKKIEQDQLMERTIRVIERVFHEETKVLDGNPLVKACRAKGALLGIEVKDKQTCIAISRRCMEAGALVSCIGSVIRITPSFVIAEDLLRKALRIICSQIQREGWRE